MGDDNELLLSDFGIAVIAHSTSSMTPQEISGTIHYMAPEQINGKPCPASDQYSLGAVVYEWLGGTRPFNGSNFIDIAMQHLNNAPPPLREKAPAISPGVEQVVMRTLAKELQARFASLRAFSTALEQAVYAVSAPTLNQPPSIIVNPVAIPGPKLLQPPEHIACQFPIDGSRDSSNIAKKLFTYRSPKFGGDKRFPPSSHFHRAIAWSPIMARVAIGTINGNVVIVDPYAETTIAEYEHGDGVAHITWSPDGRFIASVGEYTSGVRDLMVMVRLDHPTSPLTAPQFSTNLKIWDTLSGREVFSTPHIGYNHSWSIWWSPDGNFLATGADRSGLQIWDMRNLGSKDEPTSTLLTSSDLSLDVDRFWWTPDSNAFIGRATNRVRQVQSTFYGTMQNGQWTLTELDVAPLARRLAIPEYLIDKILRLSPDERSSFSWTTRRLACGSHTQNKIEIYDPHTGSKPLDILEYSDFTGVPGSTSKRRLFAWSPDGTTLAYDLPTKHSMRFLHFNPEPSMHPESENGGTHWNIERFVPQGTDSSIAYIYWSANGKLLATTGSTDFGLSLDTDIWQVNLN
jgi:serine/threonine protein kinase